jgi:hypothetical protein
MKIQFHLTSLVNCRHDLHRSGESQLLDSLCTLTIFLPKVEQAQDFQPVKE